MIKLDIIVHPTLSEPQVAIKEEKKVIQKWKFSWRIKMLAKPKAPIAQKYKPPPAEGFPIRKPLDPTTEFYADHLSRPLLRRLLVNRSMYAEQGPKYVKIVTKAIDKTWDSIYNFYRKRLRDRKLKRLKRKMQRLQAKKPKGKELEAIENKRKEHLSKMAAPKKIFLPEKLPKKWKPLEELIGNIEVLAAPKEYDISPPREIGKVASAALQYEITETVLKLAQSPDRMKARPPEVHPPGYVNPGALKAKCTPRIEKLAMPSFSAREAKKQDEDKYDPWAISPNALKYKPSARILELAKPLERE